MSQRINVNSFFAALIIVVTCAVAFMALYTPSVVLADGCVNYSAPVMVCPVCVGPSTTCPSWDTVCNGWQQQITSDHFMCNPAAGSNTYCIPWTTLAGGFLPMPCCLITACTWDANLGICISGAVIADHKRCVFVDRPCAVIVVKPPL